MKVIYTADERYTLKRSLYSKQVSTSNSAVQPSQYLFITVDAEKKRQLEQQMTVRGTYLDFTPSYEVKLKYIQVSWYKSEFTLGWRVALPPLWPGHWVKVTRLWWTVGGLAAGSGWAESPGQRAVDGEEAAFWTERQKETTGAENLHQTGQVSPSSTGSKTSST